MLKHQLKVAGTSNFMLLHNRIAILPLMLSVLAAAWVARADGAAVGHNEVIDTFPPGSQPPEGTILSFDPSGGDTNSYWTHLGTNAPSLAFAAYPWELYLYERSTNLLSGSWTTWAGFNNLYTSEYPAVKTGIDAGGENAFFRIVKVEGGALATVPPPRYETFQPPTAGEWFTDPVFGTPIKRLTDEQNVIGFNGERAMFSADDQYFVIAVKPPRALRLFDGRTGDFIRDLPLFLTDQMIVRWCYDPQMLVYAEGNSLIGYNVVTDATTNLATFSEPIGDATGRLCGGDGNDFDDAGEWLLLNMGDRMFAYNIRTGETGPEKDMSGYSVDYCTISASGSYILGNMSVDGVTNGGTRIWNRDWTNERQLSPKGAHMDTGYLNGTEECLVSRTTGGAILAVRFSDGEIYKLLESDTWLQPMFGAVGGSNRRCMYVALESQGLDPAVEWHRYLGELLQVPLVTGSGPVRRLAHHRARPTDGSLHTFQDQPEAWINHAGDRLFFRSNMDNFAELGKHDLYMIELDPAPGGWTELLYDDFEGGFGHWNDGGTDCVLYTGGSYAHQGSNAVNLQDNTATSVMSTGNLTLSTNSEVKVELWYYADSMDDSTEDFWLQISTDGGSSYTMVKSWAQGIDFDNGQFYMESVVISGYPLTDQTRLRFRCDANGDADDVYIDEVRVSVQ